MNSVCDWCTSSEASAKMSVRKDQGVGAKEWAWAWGFKRFKGILSFTLPVKHVPTGNVGTTVQFSVTMFTCQSANRCLFLEAENDILTPMFSQCRYGSSMSCKDMILHDMT